MNEMPMPDTTAAGIRNGELDRAANALTAALADYNAAVDAFISATQKDAS